MKITSVCCHLSIVLRFEMHTLLSFLFVLFHGLLFNNFSVNEVCDNADVTSFHDGCDNDVVNSIILLFFTLEPLKYT